MRVGVQYRGQVNPSATERVFTYNWPADWHVLWYVTPTNPRSGAPQIDFDTEVERASADRITYWIMIRNLTNQPVDYRAALRGTELMSVRIVIEFDTADGRATVTTEPHPQGEGMQGATATGLVEAAEATDAGPPAAGTPLTGRTAGVVAVDAGPAPDAVAAVDGDHA